MSAELGPEGLDRLKPIVAEMKTHGIESVRVEFYGGGDDGQIEGVEWSKEPPADTRVDVVTEKRKYNLEGSFKYTLVTETKSLPLEQAIEEITYDLLDKSGVDWVNNDGGSGYLEINLSKPEGAGTVEFSIHVHELISHEQHHEVILV